MQDRNLAKIVGGINRESSLRAEKIVRKLGGSTTVVSSPKVAEMCKLVDNLYRSNNIAFANELGEVCESIGIKASEVVSAVNNSYPRTRVFSPGLGADGPCLSKDPIIFKHAAAKYNVDTPVTKSTIIQNEKATLRVADLVKDFILRNNPQSTNLAVIGLAFKGFPETDDLRGSPAQKIINKLKKENIFFNSIKLFDPLVKQFPGHENTNSISEAVKDANIILFLTNHPRLMNLELDSIISDPSRKTFILDAWGNINISHIPENVEYFRIGHGKY